jgi:hypothetical protein
MAFSIMDVDNDGKIGHRDLLHILTATVTLLGQDEREWAKVSERRDHLRDWMRNMHHARTHTHTHTHARTHPINLATHASLTRLALAHYLSPSQKGAHLCAGRDLV